ncbi:MAG: replicative DNA helicase [Chloroflexi bacterium]|nr:replicative DNA helicase [Chloroflexota bacterium]MCI0784494.1 replicative DNA helicase [Chloroflexota bacterium]MCI0819508.1 replicative DNA helicase [Chloroflexota bacterium]MCI0839836.1 replicative DNA helicase [Chloroflexota bacterium]
MVVESGPARGGEKLPPHDNEAEAAVVASLLVDPEAIFKVAPRLKGNDFFREKNGWVYDACRALWDRNEAINQITVAHELERSSRLEDVGGLAYLSRLVTDLPTSVGVENYASIVQRDATYRKMITAAGQIAQIAYQGGADVGGALGQAETLIAAVRQGESLRDFQHIRDLLSGYLEQLESGTSSDAAQSRAITSGYADLDTMLAPGLKRGDLIIVAARPSLGKTSLVLNFARNAALRHNATVGFFSVEMAADQLVQRTVAMEAGVDSTRLVLGTYSDREEARIMQALGVLSELPLYFDDAATLTVAEMRAKARRLQLERGLDLIVVDYLQLMSSGSHNENRVQEVSYISRSLKQLARDLDVPVVACSQLSRASEHRANNIPMLSDLRESGSIEQDADVVMFIYREDKYVSREQWDRDHSGDERRREYPAGITQLIVAKHRNGATGTIHLRFREKIARFEDLLMREPEQPEETEWEGQE